MVSKFTTLKEYTWNGCPLSKLMHPSFGYMTDMSWSSGKEGIELRKCIDSNIELPYKKSTSVKSLHCKCFRWHEDFF